MQVYLTLLQVSIGGRRPDAEDFGVTISISIYFCSAALRAAGAIYVIFLNFAAALRAACDITRDLLKIPGGASRRRWYFVSFSENPRRRLAPPAPFHVVFRKSSAALRAAGDMSGYFSKIPGGTCILASCNK